MAAAKERAAKKVSRHTSRGVASSTMLAEAPASLAHLRKQLEEFCNGLEVQLSAARGVLSILK